MHVGDGESEFLYQYYMCAGFLQAHSTCSAEEHGSIKRRWAADWGRVGVWICDGVPSSLWEQPGWAWQAWMHDAGSHLALDGTPEGDTGWCQPSENTSSMFENENDMFIYTVALCESSNCVPAELWHSQILHVLHMFTARRACLQGHCSLKLTVVQNGKIGINRISIKHFYYSGYGLNL